MNVGDLIQVSERVHSSMGRNKLGIVTCVDNIHWCSKAGKYVPAINVYLAGYGHTHYSIDAVKLVNGINTQKEVEDVKSK